MPDEREWELIDRWWRAANYLSVGQIYLLDNPLLHGAGHRCAIRRAGQS